MSGGSGLDKDRMRLDRPPSSVERSALLAKAFTKGKSLHPSLATSTGASLYLNGISGGVQHASQLSAHTLTVIGGVRNTRRDPSSPPWTNANREPSRSSALRG